MKSLLWTIQCDRCNHLNFRYFVNYCYISFDRNIIFISNVGFTAETTDWMVMTVTGASIGGAVLLLLLCLICQRREHQRRHSHMLPGGSVHSYSGHQHVCDELGQRFASVDSV